jgi:predicted regulator of Ras-like GTPase activity (Roadblock/LC7/MglB family)
MVLLERASEQETISCYDGSRINGILRELLSLSGAGSAQLVHTEGSLIAQTQKVDAPKMECVGMLCGLMCAAAQAIANSVESSLCYVHQHGDKKDVLLLPINEKFNLVIAFHQELGLGGILYNARRSAVALKKILGTVRSYDA